MNDELAPCPFCGKGNVEISYGNREYWGYCKYCGVSSAMYSNKHMAVAQWNTRPEQEEYKEFEFCKDIMCSGLLLSDKPQKECQVGMYCSVDMKQFQNWLKSHNYKIVKTKEG